MEVELLRNKVAPYRKLAVHAVAFSTMPQHLSHFKSNFIGNFLLSVFHLNLGSQTRDHGSGKRLKHS